MMMTINIIIQSHGIVKSCATDIFECQSIKAVAAAASIIVFHQIIKIRTPITKLRMANVWQTHTFGVISHLLNELLNSFCLWSG